MGGTGTGEETQELLHETMKGLGKWMEDVWSMVPEFETEWMYGHECSVAWGEDAACARNYEVMGWQDSERVSHCGKRGTSRRLYFSRPSPQNAFRAS